MNKTYVNVKDDVVEACRIYTQDDGKGAGDKVTFEKVNNDTVRYPNIRRLPEWAKDVLISKTEYNSIVNGKAEVTA